MECWVLNAVLHYSTIPVRRKRKTPPPGDGGVLWQEDSSLLRCDSGEQVILTPLDEQKNVGLIFGLL